MNNNLENSNFENLLQKSESNLIRDFLIKNGKEGKIFCPVSFEKNMEENNTKEESNDSKIDK